METCSAVLQLPAFAFVKCHIIYLHLNTITILPYPFLEVPELFLSKEDLQCRPSIRRFQLFHELNLEFSPSHGFESGKLQSKNFIIFFVCQVLYLGNLISVLSAEYVT